MLASMLTAGGLEVEKNPMPTNMCISMFRKGGA